MITIQHQETEKSGVFEAWMRATEEGACTEPVQYKGKKTTNPTLPLPTREGKKALRCYLL